MHRRYRAATGKTIIVAPSTLWLSALPTDTERYPMAYQILPGWRTHWLSALRTRATPYGVSIPTAPGTHCQRALPA